MFDAAINTDISALYSDLFTIPYACKDEGPVCEKEAFLNEYKSGSAYDELQNLELDFQQWEDSRKVEIKSWSKEIEKLKVKLEEFKNGEPGRDIFDEFSELETENDLNSKIRYAEHRNSYCKLTLASIERRYFSDKRDLFRQKRFVTLYTASANDARFLVYKSTTQIKHCKQLFATEASNPNSNMLYATFENNNGDWVRPDPMARGRNIPPEVLMIIDENGVEYPDDAYLKDIGWELTVCVKDLVKCLPGLNRDKTYFKDGNTKILLTDPTCEDFILRVLVTLTTPRLFLAYKWHFNDYYDIDADVYDDDDYDANDYDDYDPNDFNPHDEVRGSVNIADDDTLGMPSNLSWYALDMHRKMDFYTFRLADHIKYQDMSNFARLTAPDLSIQQISSIAQFFISGDSMTALLMKKLDFRYKFKWEKFDGILSSFENSLTASQLFNISESLIQLSQGKPVDSIGDSVLKKCRERVEKSKAAVDNEIRYLSVS